MHELSIAQSILDTVVAEATEHRAQRVVNIRLRIGELTAIVRDALTFSFEVIAKDTCAEGAVLDIEHIPWQLRCSGCQHAYVVQRDNLACPLCGATGGETIAGRELQILEMDVE